ncbi:MAG: 16S rRNA processing protein RimM [Myxococcales bacterium]|nr:16S rRNA processing protein RimM [Myxococcales bacterium]
MSKRSPRRPTNPSAPARLPLLRPTHSGPREVPSSVPSQPKIPLPAFATPQPNETQLVSLGYLTRAHGLDGAVRIHLHNPEGDTLFEVESLFLKREGERRFRQAGIRLFREHANEFLLELEGVNGREQAEALRRTEIFVEREQLPALEDGEYYFFQLEGIPVFTPSGEQVGTVLRVQEAPAQNLLVVQTNEGEEAMIPMVPALVTSIDLPNRHITITPIPGLLGDDDSKEKA